MPAHSLQQAVEFVLRGPTEAGQKPNGGIWTDYKEADDRDRPKNERADDPFAHFLSE